MNGRGDGADWRRTLLLVAFAAAVLAPSLVGRELLPPDEPRFAVITREALARGDLVVLRRGGETYLDKPPLFFWLQAAAFTLAGGPGEAAARVPSLLASLALVALTHRAARRWGGEPLATRATLVLGACSLMVQRGAWGATDPLLAACAFGALVALERATSGSPRAAYAAAAALAAGTLVKGPVALMPCAFGALAAWATRARHVSLRPLLRPGPLALGLALLAPWPLAAASRLGWSTLFGAWWHHNAERFVASWDNIEPFWYQPEALALGLAPFSLLAWPALRRAAWRDVVRDGAQRWTLVTLALALLFFSIPAGKRGVYLLPFYPFAAYAVAWSLDWIAAHGGARRAAAIAAGLGAAIALGAAISAGAFGRWPLPHALAGEPAVRRAITFVLGGLAAALTAAAVAAWRGRGSLIAGPAVLAAMLGLSAPWVAAPAINAAQGARAIALALPHGAVLGATRTKWDVVAWYAGAPVRRLASPGEVARFLGERDGTPRGAIGPADELGPAADWPAGTRAVAQLRLGRETFLVVRGP